MQELISGRIFLEDDEIHIEHNLGKVVGLEMRIGSQGNKYIYKERETGTFSEGGEERLAGEGDQEVSQPYEIKKNLSAHWR